jgi:hypothetical protein
MTASGHEMNERRIDCLHVSAENCIKLSLSGQYLTVVDNAHTALAHASLIILPWWFELLCQRPHGRTPKALLPTPWWQVNLSL